LASQEADEWALGSIYVPKTAAHQLSNLHFAEERSNISLDQLLLGDARPNFKEDVCSFEP
jgi:hypothetical protein